jgi:type VI secretion system secreted protein Hcp
MFSGYLKLDGIDGESQADGHEKEIDLLSFSWGASNPGSGAYGSGSGTGVVTVSDFVITKRMDSSSALLAQACCSGLIAENAVVVFRKQSGGAPVEYVKYTFNGVLVSGYSASGAMGGGDDVPTESVSFNFDKWQIDYVPQADTGSGQGNVHGGWDVRKIATI